MIKEFIKKNKFLFSLALFYKEAFLKPGLVELGDRDQGLFKELKTKEKKIVYFNPNTNSDEECSIFNGECKLQWKVDWAMRWFVLGVDYEMNGKDLIESFILSNRILFTFTNL